MGTSQSPTQSSSLPQPPSAAEYEQWGLDQWQDYLLALHPVEIDMGLERVRAVYERMQLSSPAIKIVVGGTNGKGSTCAFLESILLAAGYKVAFYSSPHLMHFSERFRLQGHPASEAEICQHFCRVEAHRQDISLTFFEFTTLAALSLFAARDCDVWVCEIGLGGRLDAVNLIDADCSILTQIDVDHQQYLGADREHIGWEKAAIFRSQRPAICADAQPPQSVLDYAQEINAPLWVMDRDFSLRADMQQWQYRGPERRRSALPFPALRGANQLPNACAALAALDALSDRLVIPIQDIKQGLLAVQLDGRFQVLPGQPMVICDVGHNPHALRAFAYNLQQLPTQGRTLAAVGMLKDKEVAHALKPLVGEVDLWLCASLEGTRGLDAQTLSNYARQAYADGATPAITPSNASSAQQNSGSTRPGTIAAGPVDTKAKGADTGFADAAAKAATTKPTVRPSVRPRNEPKAVKPLDVQCYDSVLEAFAAAQRQSTVNDKIIVFGSFMTVGPVLAHYQPR